MTIKYLRVHVLNIVTIKIAVRGSMIWRRLKISGSTSLALFQHVIQIDMGWDDDY